VKNHIANLVIAFVVGVLTWKIISPESLSSFFAIDQLDLSQSAFLFMGLFFICTVCFSYNSENGKSFFGLLGSKWQFVRGCLLAAICFYMYFFG
jgi:hypothetical protein